MIIRKATKKDLKAVANLDKQFWDIHKKIDPLIAPVQLDHLESAKAVIRSKTNFYFVADIDGIVVGAINFQIKKNNNFFKVKEYGYIDAVIVGKEHKRDGIAKELTKFAFDFLKKRKIKYVKANVYLKNFSARKAWKSAGFKEKNINLLKKL